MNLIRLLLIVIMFPILLCLEVIGTSVLYASIWLDAVGLQMLADDKEGVMESYDATVSILEKKNEALRLIVRTASKNRAKELGCLDEIIENLEDITQQ